VLEVGDHLHPLLKLGTLHLESVLEVYNPVGMDPHLLMSEVRLQMGVVLPVLDLTKAMIHDLQLAVLI
jgi:hypothetical protein